MIPSKTFLTEDLKALYDRKYFNVRETTDSTIVEFVYHYDYHDTYAVRVVGKRKAYHGLCFDAGVLDFRKDNRYFFQIDTGNAFDRCKGDYSLLYDGDFWHRVINRIPD